MGPLITPTMPGMLHGAYNDSSQAQASVLDACRDLFISAGQEVPLPGHDRPLIMAEWGCSHGRNSIAPVLLLCEQLQQRLQDLTEQDNRSHCKPLQVHVVHTDVPTNDWSTLFTCAHEYAQQAQHSCPELHVTYAGIGGSMYCTNHPPQTVDLGFSLVALHWQSKKVLNPQKAIIFTPEHLLPEEWTVMQRHAESDLRTFLRLRAQEFRPGGVLVLAYPSSPASDAELPSCYRAGRYNNLPQQVADAMVAEGLLQPHEPGMMSTPVFFLPPETQKQIYAECSDAWELLHFGPGVTCDPVTKAWRDKQATDADLAESFASFYKAFSHPCFKAGLLAAGREEADADRLLDEYWRRMQLAAEATPTAVEVIFVSVLLKRRG